MTASVILAAFAALAALSFLGDRLLSTVFVAVAGFVLVRNARECPKR